MGEKNLSVVEVETEHWWTGEEKCPHEQDQIAPPCSRCRVPVRFVVCISGEPRFYRGNEFLVGY